MSVQQVTQAAIERAEQVINRKNPHSESAAALRQCVDALKLTLQPKAPQPPQLADDDDVKVQAYLREHGAAEDVPGPAAPKDTVSIADKRLGAEPGKAPEPPAPKAPRKKAKT